MCGVGISLGEEQTFHLPAATSQFPQPRRWIKLGQKRSLPLGLAFPGSHSNFWWSGILLWLWLWLLPTFRPSVKLWQHGILFLFHGNLNGLILNFDLFFFPAQEETGTTEFLRDDYTVWNGPCSNKALAPSPDNTRDFARAARLMSTPFNYLAAPSQLPLENRGKIRNILGGKH